MSSPQVDAAAPAKTPVSDRIGQAVDVAAVLGFVVTAFGASFRGIAALSLIAFCGTICGSYFFEKRPSIATRLTSGPIPAAFAVTALLATALAGALIRQHWIDSQKISDLGEISDTLKWRLRFCFGKQSCIFSVLGSLPERIRPRSEDPAEELFRDQALGEVARTSDTANEALRNAYGLYRNSFLGTGISLPSASRDFTAERVPEYLVPNYSDDHDGVLWWRMEQGDPLLNGSLAELLEHEPTVKGPTSDRDRTLIRDNLVSADKPSLVRFAMVPDLNRGDENRNYSHCFGLPQRRFVFFSALDHMMRHTSKVIDAAGLSGYKFAEPKPGEKQYIYVFMLAPIDASELVSPTWNNLLVHLNDPSPCPVAKKVR